MNMYRFTRLFAVLCVLLIATTAWAGKQDVGKAAAMDLQLLAAIPADPLLAAVLKIEAPETHWDQLIGAIGEIVPESEQAEVDKALAKVDEELGLSLRNDLLAVIGPEMALIIDLPPIDMVVGQVMGQTPEGIEQALGSIGLLWQLRDAEKIDQTLQTLFTKAGATIEPQEGFVKLIFPVAGEGQPPIHAYYGIKGQLAALGFSVAWVQTTLAGRAEGQRLADGEDFARIARHLDTAPSLLYYINLPKLRGMIADSQMIQGAVSAKPEVQRLVSNLLNPENLRTGMAGTCQLTDDGMRRVSFGPPWLGSAVTSGIIAGIAVPNLIAAIDRGRQQRTMAEMRTIATAAEMYSVDTGHYPTSNGEWVGIVAIADKIAPEYIPYTPENDGWKNPYRYWCDGEKYIIVSTGRDGELDQEWTVDAELRETQDFDADIVYIHGAFISYPLGVQH